MTSHVKLAVINEKYLSRSLNRKTINFAEVFYFLFVYFIPRAVLLVIQRAHV
jgi:hypothetical protein